MAVARRLHVPVFGKLEQVVSLLIALGANLKIDGGKLGSPSQVAAWNHDRDIARQLLMHVVELAASISDFELFRCLVENADAESPYF